MAKHKDALNKSVTRIKKAMGIKNPIDEKVNSIKTYRDYLDKNV